MPRIPSAPQIDSSPKIPARSEKIPENRFKDEAPSTESAGTSVAASPAPATEAFETFHPKGASGETPAAVEALPMMRPADLQAWMNMGNIAMSTLFRTNDAMMRGAMAWGQEMVDFTQMRLHEGAERSEYLFHCTDPLAALDLHRQFAVKATGHYLEEAGKLTTIAMQTAGLFWAPIEEGTREALDRIAPVSANGSMAGA